MRQDRRFMLFRKNINALRALAVAAVVLYHFNVPGFSGGFVGVDVFFVISGFLMTGCPALGEFQMRDQPLQQACIAYNHKKLARLGRQGVSLY
jgi:peptidoglycan/LPS O-acetylase OafA/YrhL